MNETTFETTFGFTGLEMVFVWGLVVAGVMLWSRSTDWVVRFLGGFLPLLAMLIVLAVANTAGIGTLWSGTVAMAGLLGILGAYLVVRLVMDAVGGKT